ncbi:MAG: hypothetical protein LAO31_02010 [Acidobacteriia bacterium]|nr:hypothetical protein [Terriglobia bacterium]
MSIKDPRGNQIIATLLMVIVGLASVAAGAETEKVVQDSLKRFSIKVPASWKVSESVDGSTFTLAGEEATFIIYPVFRGNDLETLHRKMALQFALRSVEGPPKKNKVKWEKRRTGNMKALESVYEIKGGPEDAHKEYRVHVITLDGEKHKFSVIVTIPLELAERNGFEERVVKMVDGFSESN